MAGLTAEAKMLYYTKLFCAGGESMCRILRRLIREGAF